MVMAENDVLFERMAYVSTAEGPKAVYVLRPDGTRAPLTGGRWQGESPAWSPDGSRIALHRGCREIIIVGSDGSDPHVLAIEASAGEPCPPSVMSPTWSPRRDADRFPRHRG